MPEDKNIEALEEFVQAVITRALECWKSRSGKIEVSVFEERGKTRATIRGGPTWKSKVEDDNE